MRNDIRLIVRVLTRSPAFMSLAVLSLAIGIGGNSTIFVLLNAVVLKTLPVSSPNELILVRPYSSLNIPFAISYPAYRELRDQNQVLNGLLAYCPLQLTVMIDGRPEPISSGLLVSGNYFQVLGVEPAVGRTISPKDDRVPSGHPVAAISYRYWQNRFSSDPAIIGKSAYLMVLSLQL